jgi:hypothetical protein
MNRLTVTKTLALKTLATTAVLTATLGATGTAFAQDVAPAPKPSQPSGPDKVAPAPQPTQPPAGPDKVAPAPKPQDPKGPGNVAPAPKKPVDPKGPGDIAPAPKPQGPKGPGDIAPAPKPQGPQGPGDIAQPEPNDPKGPGDIANPTGCVFTHGCPTDGDGTDGFTSGDASVDTDTTGTEAGGSGLPFTGDSAQLYAEVGGALLGAGLLALVAARRRKAHRSTV